MLQMYCDNEDEIKWLSLLHLPFYEAGSVICEYTIL